MARAVRVYEERLREGGHGGGRAASSQPAGDGLGARREGRRAGGQARTATGSRARARATGRQTGRPNLGRSLQLRRLRRTDATQRQLGSGASTEHRATADQGLQNNRRGGRADTLSLRADSKYESEKGKRKKKNTSRGAGSRSRICALMDCRCRPPQGARSKCTNNYGLAVGLRLHEQSQRAQRPLDSCTPVSCASSDGAGDYSLEQLRLQAARRCDGPPR